MTGERELPVRHWSLRTHACVSALYARVCAYVCARMREDLRRCSPLSLVSSCAACQRLLVPSSCRPTSQKRRAIECVRGGVKCNDWQDEDGGRTHDPAEKQARDESGGYYSTLNFSRQSFAPAAPRTVKVRCRDARPCILRSRISPPSSRTLSLP